MIKYIKANNILMIKVSNNNFKLITIWLKIARLEIYFLNQPFFLKSSTRAMMSCISGLVKVLGLRALQVATNLINDLSLR